MKHGEAGGWPKGSNDPPPTGAEDVYKIWRSPCVMNITTMGSTPLRLGITIFRIFKTNIWENLHKHITKEITIRPPSSRRKQNARIDMFWFRAIDVTLNELIRLMTTKTCATILQRAFWCS